MAGHHRHVRRLKAQATGSDGKQYLVPLDYYPWAVFYRPSLFTERGYTVPKTLDELVTLSTKMQSEGLTPIAFGDKDGWPAMGTFDQLNLRINGYQFHVDLMAGKEAWDSDKVKTVFDTWRRLLPYHQPDSLGRTWQEAAQSLQQKKSGMYVLGMFVGQQFTAGADLEDLDFFTFPEVDPAVGTDAIEAPIDGFMMAARPRNEAAAKKFLATSHRSRGGRLPQGRRFGGRRELERQHRELLQAAEEGRGVHGGREVRRPVHGPRHPARLRLDGDDPGDPAVHRQPERHRRARQEHREPEEVDLHELTTMTVQTAAPPRPTSDRVDRRGRVRRLTTADLVVVGLMIAVPT